jgi:hypothetical protein
MSNQKRIGLEGTIKAYAGSTELPAESSGERQAVLCVQTAKKRPFSDSKPTSENRGRLPHNLRDHMGGVGGNTRTHP